VPDADFFTRPRFCSHCGGTVVVEGASFCKDCGASLEAAAIMLRRPISSQRVIAFLLSIIPGLGHIYQGHVVRGIVWFFGVGAAYGAGPIGYLLHFICAISAASYGSDRNRDDDRWPPRRLRRRANRLSASLRN
jgi:TM2 domain-containing membrane protein YozV